MVSLMLDDDIVEQLQNMSAQQNRPVSEVIRQLLAERREAQPVGNPNWLRKMAEMVEQDTDIVWKDEPDLSERSREILNNEFADYLIRRMERNENTDADDTD